MQKKKRALFGSEKRLITGSNFVCNTYCERFRGNTYIPTSCMHRMLCARYAHVIQPFALEAYLWCLISGS